ASSLGGLAALSLGPSLLAQEKKKAKEKAKAAPPVVSNDPLASLFLTWQQDPTTTMTIQWVGSDMASEPTIQYSPLAADDWKPAKTIRKPFPDTELKVRRCELTGLTPGTEYKFRLGGAANELRFRTMPAKATNTI